MPNHFVVFGTDKPDASELRDQLREAHRVYIRTSRKGVVAVLGGLTLDIDGRMNGTMLVVQSANVEDAREFVDNDPYSQAGLFDKAEVRAWRWGLGQPSA